MPLIPTKAIHDNLKRAKRYAQRAKDCQGWTPAKRKRMITGKGGLNILVPGSRIYKGLKFKSGTGDCLVYADKALEKLAKAKAIHKKARNKAFWTQAKQTKWKGEIAQAERFIHRKLGLNQAEAAEAAGFVEAKATRDAPGISLKGAPMTGAELSAYRARIINQLRFRGTAYPTAPAPSEESVMAMGEEQLALLEESLDSEDDQTFDVSPSSFSLDTFTDTSSPVFWVGAAALTGLGIWGLTKLLK